MEHITKSELDYFGKGWSIEQRLDYVLENYCTDLKIKFPYGPFKISYEILREGFLKNLKGDELAKFVGYKERTAVNQMIRNTVKASLPETAPIKPPTTLWLNYLLKLFDIIQDTDIKSRNIYNLEYYTLETIYRVALTNLDNTLVLNSEELVTSDSICTALVEVGSASKTHEQLGVKSHTSITDYLCKGLPNTKYRERTKLTYKLLELVNLKKCHDCQEIKSIDSFKSKSSDMIGNVCRPCTRAQSATRRAKIRNADYSKAFKCEDKVRSIYHKAKDGEHVDHIVPLTNDLVCGLHVSDNLQILSAHDNLSKNNKFDPTTFRHSLPDGRDVYGN